jgi:hypothetical protein
VIDLDKFPDLKDKSHEEIEEWVYKNKNSLGVTDYDDPSPRDDMGDASEIVPLKDSEDILADTLGYNGVKWDKIKNEKRYFTCVREEEDEDEVSS